MNVQEIVDGYLSSHGYDGLYDPLHGEECGCVLGDLMPCAGCAIDRCQPGVNNAARAKEEGAEFWIEAGEPHSLPSVAPDHDELVRRMLRDPRLRGLLVEGD